MTVQKPSPLPDTIDFAQNEKQASSQLAVINSIAHFVQPRGLHPGHVTPSTAFPLYPERCISSVTSIMSSSRLPAWRSPVDRTVFPYHLLEFRSRSCTTELRDIADCVTRSPVFPAGRYSFRRLPEAKSLLQGTCPERQTCWDCCERSLTARLRMIANLCGLGAGGSLTRALKRAPFFS